MTEVERNGSSRRFATVWTSLVGPLGRRFGRVGLAGRGPAPLYEALAVGLGCDVVGQPASHLTARKAPDRPA